MWDIQEGRNPVVYGDGSQTRDFVYVEDVVNACVRAAESTHNGVYNVGTGKSYSVNEMLAKVMDALGKHPTIKYVETPVSNYVMHTQADTSKAERELGFKAKYSLDEGIRLTLSKESSPLSPRPRASD
jgi:UDP-glucose 4-epimerase